MDILNLDLSARFTFLDGRLRVRGGFLMSSSKTEESISAIAPPPFTRTGLKGGVSYKLIDNLNLVTDFKFQNKQVEVEGKTESLPDTKIAARLEYTFWLSAEVGSEETHLRI